MKKIAAAVALTLGWMTLLASWANAAPHPGSLDRSFAGNGMTLQGFGHEPGRGGASAVALQRDGKAIALMPARGSSMEYSIARISPDGGIDTTFGDGGFASGDFGVTSSEAVGVAVQADEKVLVAGKAWGGAPSRFAVTRYTAEGRLDPGFGGDGTVLYPGNPSFRFGNPEAMVLQPDGKILLAGALLWEPQTQIEVLRLNVDGTVDRSYGNDGISTVPVPEDFISISARALAMQAGKLVVAARGSSGNLLMRLKADGSLDKSFGRDGMATTNLSRADELAVQPDGRILLVGGWVTRLTPNGSEDTSFGDGGFARLPSDVSANAGVSA